ncbi:MAG: HAD family hydrolase [Sediminimonas sp.]|uniref:HAD family hydrolase n=1 Tax=Sediminimonas sp. TaxID=2823379 RepID=UPI002870603F|nr:HAD family hydrolase [Sediminimonas sp.]MDR9485739.1 HAD family hydrolase [Sediminimonas sp.]
MKVDGVLFDKDGTLFDFRATWDVWVADVIETLSGGDAALAGAIAGAARYDLETRRFDPGSPIIAGTNREAAELLCSVLPGRNVDEVEQYLMITAARAPLAPAVPLAPFLSGLTGRGLRLGVMTNDTEFGAHAHLESAGVAAHFEFVAGFDSGHGAKPEPGPLLAFAAATGLRPGRVVMVGDSPHDLIAGRAAGMQTVGVLTGPAGHEDLTPWADTVLPDIGHLSAWVEV